MKFKLLAAAVVAVVATPASAEIDQSIKKVRLNQIQILASDVEQNGNKVLIDSNALTSPYGPRGKNRGLSIEQEVKSARVNQVQLLSRGATQNLNYVDATGNRMYYPFTQ